jgi:HEAT repeat protein
MWHLIGLIAAFACFLAVMQFRRETEDPGYRWTRQLRSSDASRRAEAARELAQIRPAERKAIAPLTEALFDAAPTVRICAAHALTNILRGKDDPEAGPVMAAMASALRDPDPKARWEFAGALARFQADSKVIVPTLLEAATKGDAYQRFMAMNCLGLYARESEPAREALFAGLGDADATVRRHAVESLASCVMHAALAPEPLQRLQRRTERMLLEAAVDASPFVRSGAVRALGGLGSRTRTEFPVVIDALADSDADVRLQAATYLAWRSPGVRSPALIPALGRALKDPDKHVRRAAARTLGRLGLDAEATLRESPADPEQDVRQEVTEALARIEKTAFAFRSTIREGIANLGDPDPAIRALGADQLARSGPRAAEGIPTLVRSLGDREAAVRLAAAVALAKLGPRAAVALPDLARRAESDDDERVRRASEASRSILLRGEDGSVP